MAADGSGGLTAVQTDILRFEPPDIATRTAISVRRAGTPWVDQLVLESDAATAPSSGTVAVAPDGAAVACLGITDLTDPEFRARYVVTERAAGSSSWFAPKPLTDFDTPTTDCTVAISPSGAAAALVEYHQPAGPGYPNGHTSLGLFARPAGGTWPTASTPVSGSGRDALGASMAFDGDGQLTVAWSERYGGTAASPQRVLKVRVWSPSNGVLSSPSLLTAEGGSESAGSPRLAVNSAGRAVIAWQWSKPDSSCATWASVRAGAGATWGEPVRIVANGASCNNPLGAGVAPDGTAYVGYWWNPAAPVAHPRVGISRMQVGGGWSPQRALGGVDLFVGVGVMTMAGSDAVMVYEGHDYDDFNRRVLQAVRWPAGAAEPEDVRDLVPPGQSQATDLGIVPDGRGGAVATWTRPGAPRATFMAAAFDASPPELVSASVPETATAGVPVTLEASFADLWSDMGAGPSWELGDGGSGTGGSVTHAWAEPGTYTVTVRAKDVFDNERASTHTVTVTPASGQPPADKTRPQVSLALPACAKKLSKKACRAFRGSVKAWRTLRGKVSDKGGSGVARVEVAVARKAGKKLLVLKGGKFRRASAKAFGRSFAKAKVKGGSWSHKLPKLRPGTYLIRVRARDRAGNVSKTVARTVRLR